MRDSDGKHRYEDEAVEIARAIRRDYAADLTGDDGGQICVWILELCDKAASDALDALLRVPPQDMATMSLHELRMLRLAIEREIDSRGAVIDGRNT